MKKIMVTYLHLIWPVASDFIRRQGMIDSILNLIYIFMALIGFQWVLYGYSLAFGADIGGLIGGVNPRPDR